MTSTLSKISDNLTDRCVVIYLITTAKAYHTTHVTCNSKPLACIINVQTKSIRGMQTSQEVLYIIHSWYLYLAYIARIGYLNTAVVSHVIKVNWCLRFVMMRIHITLLRLRIVLNNERCHCRWLWVWRDGAGGSKRGR